MSRVLLLLEHSPNRHLLAQWLTQHHQVVQAESEQALQESFDLGILDGPALHRVWEAVQARKRAEEPMFLPVLLLTSREGVDVATRHLWRTIDEVVLRPVEKIELQARMEILLRVRQLSLALKQRHDDLQAFIHAMAHDLRAPVRITAGFARELLADKDTTLSVDGRSCLHRILSATDDMQQLMTSLLEFGRLGRGAVRPRRISLRQVVARCLRNLRDEIQATHARITVSEEQAILYADPILLKVALTNFLANALKFVAPGVRPHVTVSASVTPGGWRLSVGDNGIGVAPEDQARVFQPFIRLHAVEEYPGVGLGSPLSGKRRNLWRGAWA